MRLSRLVRPFRPGPPASTALGGLVLSVVFVGLPAARVQAEPRKLPPAENLAVKELDDDGMVGIETRFHVRVEPAEAYRLLSDFEHLAEFMPSLRTCEILERTGATVVLRMKADLGELVQRRVHEPPSAIRWTLVSSPVLRRLRGGWFIEPEGGGSALTYRVQVEPMVPAPPAMVRWSQTQALGTLVRNVRARLESHGAWKKP
ncbi:MAG: SRPBCC family protein [bacterium]|nr:SRPBCC family protein [bacterium]